jgi:LDH2 family malate/lactate/ureidoglycolate dehydrogenase
MYQIKAAADLLGMDLGGDTGSRQPQELSDDKMRESKGMIVQVMGAAEVKDQKKVVKHLQEAVHQINAALGIK